MQWEDEIKRVAIKALEREVKKDSWVKAEGWEITVIKITYCQIE